MTTSARGTPIRSSRWWGREGLLEVAVAEGQQGLVAIETTNMAYDPEDPDANPAAHAPEAVTKDQLNIGLTGQLRFRVVRAEPLRVSLRREEPDRAHHGLLHLGPARAHRELRSSAQIAPRRRSRALIGREPGRRHLDQRPAQEPARPQPADGRRVPVVRGALRHRARRLADHRHRPAAEVESALAAINTAHNHVSARYQPGAGRGRPEDRAVEARGRDRDPATPRPRSSRCCGSRSSSALKKNGPGVLEAYLRNVRLGLLFGKAKQVDRWR